VKELCALVHQHGGRVYVDGANMNALVGVAAPGEFGGDVSHLNLHKTFCIPHGGGGPGVGPVCVVEDLVPFLPGHATAAPARRGRRQRRAPGQCRRAADQLDVHPHDGRRRPAGRHRDRHPQRQLHQRAPQDHYPTLYASANGHVAHECILDLRPLKDTSGVMAEDVAKRLIDYGFHAPR
jgi:glycine dehydrogenase